MAYPCSVYVKRSVEQSLVMQNAAITCWRRLSIFVDHSLTENIILTMQWRLHELRDGSPQWVQRAAKPRWGVKLKHFALCNLRTLFADFDCRNDQHLGSLAP